MTQLAQFCLQQGLVITRIDEFVQFYPEKCYANLAKSIISYRRLADFDPDKQGLAFSQKLLGNSLYSLSLLDSRRFPKITYTDSISVNKAANSNRFVYLNEISDDVHEIKCLKINIIHDKPLQVGVFVDQYSKLHMLKCFCCFFFQISFEKTLGICVFGH